MSKAKQILPIPFRIGSIETKQYALVQEQVDEITMEYKADFVFGIDPDKQLINCQFKYELVSGNTAAIILEVSLDFILPIKIYHERIFNGQDYIIPKEFAIHQAMVTVGTARGILHEKTNGHLLNRFPIPVIDVQSAINEEIHFVLSTNK